MVDLNELQMPKVIMLVAIAVMMIYLLRITEPIPNYNPITGKVVYAQDALAVIPAGVTGFHAAIVIGLAVMIAFTGQQGRSKITAEQAEKIALAEAEKRKKSGQEEWNGKIIPGMTFLQEVILQNQAVPFRWWKGITVKMQDIENYYSIQMDMEGNITGVVKKDTELSYPDICEKCGGTMSHIKKYLPQELYLLKDMRGALGRT